MILDTVNELVRYARYHLDLNEDDEIYVRNFLLGELELTHPSFEEIKNDDEIKKMIVPDKYIDEIKEYLINELHYDELNADLKANKIMGVLSPLPSEVNKKFYDLKKEDPAKSLDYLYNLSIKNNYVQKTRIDKNIVWKTDWDDKNIEISINLSKPEKNNKDTAKLLLKADPNDIKYPKCLLCKENQGFFGNAKHPARENIRIVPLNLDGETWYIQYSPYGYYYKHCIVLSDRHSNMVINRNTFKKLSDFVDMFPSFFLGSNAELPIVGGSILNHEHYQGGEHILPLMECGTKREFEVKNFKETKVYQLDWYNSCLLIETKNKEELIEVATRILDAWKSYDSPENDILSHDENNRYSTVTPSIRKVNGTYKLYLILRNNRCNEEHPDGIFHAHKECHHIKKESIGIIEAMGLFVLPARLVRQENEIKDCLENKLSNEDIIKKYPDLADFKSMIDELRVNYNKETIDEDIKHYIEKICKIILTNTAVFKDTELGNRSFLELMKGANL